MKRIFTILLLFAGLGLSAQPYNNEWIDFSKTYFKFKVGSEGLYRISQTVLASAGLGNTPAEYFQLFRNGQEIPIYTSVPSGIMGVNDYIEFWGQINDGKADKALYRNPASQHTDKYSLETDTAAYFLTVNNSGIPFHFVVTANDTTGNILAPEPYFMYTKGAYFRSQINPGFAQPVGEYIYSSSYEVGEFWSSGFINQFTPLSDVQNNLFVYAAGPNSTLSFGAAGCADTLRHLQVKVNNLSLKDTSMNSFNDVHSNASFATALIGAGTATIQFFNNSQASTFNDRIVASFYELTYPRQFNFGAQSNFSFELPAKLSGYYLQISNFNSGAGVPVLYDQATGQRFTAIVGGGTLYFELPGSATGRKLVLVSEDPANVNFVNSLTQKNFVHYTIPANQGNYLIISHPNVYTGSSGNNPVIDYRNYRSSVAGGGFNSLVVDINELVDQFAFGIKKHPLAVKNFLNYARNVFPAKPQFVFIIGRGVAYNDYRLNENNPIADQLNLVPTFGYPASDNMLSSADGTHAIPITPIGRLSAINGQEVEIYLNKMKEYESAQQTAPNTIAGRDWMKHVVHVTGATDPFLQSVLCNYMYGYKLVISDTSFGANVSTFCSTTFSQDDQVSSQLFPSMFSSGINILTYFGHSSVASLGFNLDDPSVYNNQGKYPVFYINGCYAGNFYTFDPARLSLGKTLSENYVLAKQKGSIAFVASTHFGVVNYLNILLSQLYNYMDHQDYGKALGVLQMDANQGLVNVLPGDYLARIHAEEISIHGDPALKISGQPLPDYDIEAPQVRISPVFISVSNNSFTVNARFVNLGKAVPDSISILITRKYPDGSTTSSKIRIPGIRYADSLQINFPIVATRDKGQNFITITVNSDNNVPEVTLLNNTVTTSVFIYQDEITPVYPYNYAIVNNPTQKLYASTANPLSPPNTYLLEMDTTALFNSPAKISKSIISIGGVVEFDPGIGYADSTVYYWRTSIQPAQNAAYHWNEFSFIYIDSLKSAQGFNQSHYFQHIASSTSNIILDSGSRTWKFGIVNNDIYIRNLIYPTASGQQSAFTITVNGQTYIGPGCNYNEIIFNIFDPITFRPWKNDYSGPTGLYQSERAVCGTQREYNFDYLYTNAAERKKAMDFLDIIPNGSYVVLRTNVNPNQAGNIYVDQWKADTALYGSNNSLYHKLFAVGLTLVDSFVTPRAIAYIYKKNDPSFIPRATITVGAFDATFISTQCQTPATSGTITSPKFGPAKQWKQVHWRGNSLESPSKDSVGVQVIGLDTLGIQTVLYNLNAATQDFDISAINATQYPYLQLKMTASDTVFGTPFQLNYWRLNDVPVPEGALAGNIYLSIKDTLEFGEKLEFGIAFKNISISAFDSMKINLTITDQNNIAHVIPLAKKRPLVSGDTLKIFYEIDTKNYLGMNTIFLDVNPNNDQPEEYHFNNFLFHNFYVKIDKTNPLLDVTFDNVHILNEDIVSAKPHILIKLKDEAKFLLLNDTSVLKVQLRYPDGSLHPYYFNSDTLRFTPASSGADNTASVDFTPVFAKQFNADGDDYQLIVTGKDKSGNPAGTIQYQVSFKVITKPMISNMLNYPNPFTTSTAFVFTITGSEVPQNIKIQILTITGKIVREITKDELGPLHIGRNITEYKWDGTDMYNQRLANGVYLYHVVTNLNGKSLDKYKASGDNTDQYFNKGYGKMYLMR